MRDYINKVLIDNHIIEDKEEQKENDKIEKILSVVLNIQSNSLKQN